MSKIKTVLKQVGKSTVERIRRNIRYKDLIKTGKLLGSIEYKVINTNNNFELQFYMVEYGKFLDEGTKYIKAQKFFNDIIDDELKKNENKILNAYSDDLLNNIDKSI